MKIGESIQIVKTGENRYFFVFGDKGAENMTWSEAIGQAAALILQSPERPYPMFNIVQASPVAAPAAQEAESEQA
jgi:hypothetical protein